MSNAGPSDSPAALVAIIIAARRAGDRDLERSARKELDRRFSVKLSFASGDTRQAGQQPQGVADGDA
jgi:hypothetical protein